MHDDNMYHIPSNITTVVDLLEDKDISWATYQENMAADAFYGFTWVLFIFVFGVDPFFRFIFILPFNCTCN
jgi:hypothetical protein